MHYDHTDAVDGKTYVHHVDNPDSYGPRYNHRPTRHMPFHVYRFRPPADHTFGASPQPTVETVETVEFTDLQRRGVLALVASATLEELDVELALDRRAAQSIIDFRATQAIETLQQLSGLYYVGPTALTALRDHIPQATGFTIDSLTANAYGRHAIDWAFITNDLSPFAGFFDLRLQTFDQLDSFASAALGGNNMEPLYCSGLAYANLNFAVNRPLNSVGLGDMWDTFQSGTYQFSDLRRGLRADELDDKAGLVAIEQLVFEPYTATDMLNVWAENALVNLPLPAVQGLINSDQFATQIVGAFRQLEWSDEEGAAGDKQSSGEFRPATIENAKRWARAYGQEESATEAYLAADPELASAVAGVPLEGLTPMDVLQVAERRLVENRFVPPRIWMDEADRAASNIRYMATVVNCELLVAVDNDGNVLAGVDACAREGDAQGATEFGEGAAETSTYPHYAVSNGGQRTHRRFDAAPGPEHFGPDTIFTVDLTHADRTDVAFLLQVPQHWQGHATAAMPMMDFDRHCTERNPAGTCIPAQAIIVHPPAGDGVLDSARLEFRLGDVCTFGEAGQATCPTAQLDESGHVTSQQETLIATGSKGLWDVTMIDLGQSATGVELERCAECATGGGQFNNWTLTVKAP